MVCQNCITKSQQASLDFGSTGTVYTDLDQIGKMVELVARNIDEAEKIKKEIEKRSEPYDRLIAEIEAEKKCATRKLTEREEALVEVVTRHLQDLQESLVAEGLIAEYSEYRSIDSSLLNKYFAEHPDELGAVSDYLTKKVVVSLQPKTRSTEKEAPVPKPVEEMTYTEKLARNQAILKARQLVQEGFVALDTETTGTDNSSQIISISYFDENGPYYSLVYTDQPIPPEATAVNHITQDMVATAPKFDQVLDECSRRIGNRTIVAYNAKFDRRMVEQTAETVNTYPLPNQWVCAMEMYKDFAALSRYAKLGVAGEHMGIAPEGDLHHAQTDAQLAYLLVKAMAEAELTDFYVPQVQIPQGIVVGTPEYKECLRQNLTDMVAEIARVRKEIVDLSAPYNQRLREIKKERDQALSDLEEKFDSLIRPSKDFVEQFGKTIEGENYQLVYAEQKRWDFRGLLDYIDTHSTTPFSLWASQNVELVRKVSIKQNRKKK